ncbi:MAG: AbrB/MazE/SpoVT family DNA-binding domain-containing protein [Gemmatimonadota bacterium]
MSDTASLFNNGGSQAVRLPREYRFTGDRVRIRREGEAVILEPLTRRAWPAEFRERFEKLPPLPDDFAAPEPLPSSGHRDVVLEDL